MTFRDALIAASLRQPTILTLGTFDGVHGGHQRLIAMVKRLALERGALAVALTFHPRPIEILRPGRPSYYLCTLDRRVALLRQAGADIVIPIEFTADLAQMTARDFCQALVDHLHLRTIVGGPDLAVGRGREGTPDRLREIGATLGFDVVIAPPFEMNGEPVRSTVIRQAILEGDVQHAARLLGRRYSIEGEIVRGDGRGRVIGVPTANLAVADRLLVPGDGIYAVYVLLGGRRLAGATSIGTRPTFNGGPRTVETHLLDFDGDLYGRQIEIEFVQRLRPELRFDTVEALIEQIRRDLDQARQILAQR